MTGSTGIAALSVEGATIHCQSGLQRGKGLASELLGRMSHACCNCNVLGLMRSVWSVLIFLSS